MRSDLPGLDDLVKGIFEIIPAYYDEYTADLIKQELADYVNALLDKRS